MIFSDSAVFDYDFKEDKVFLNVNEESISFTKEELQEMIMNIENNE